MNRLLLERCLDQRTSYSAVPDGLYQSAVMVLVQLINRRWHFVLIVRSSDLALHAGEIAFAGGRCEPGDTDPEATALREVEEELGISKSSIEVLGSLRFVQTLASGYAIVPVVGILETGFSAFVPEPAEVEDVLVVPVDEFLTGSVTLGPEYYFMKGHIYHGRVIWGATYRVIQEYLKCIKNS